MENIKCNNEGVSSFRIENKGEKSFSLISQSLYNISFYDNYGFITKNIQLNVKINGIMSDNKARCNFYSYSRKDIIFELTLYCDMYEIDMENNDRITFEECNEYKMKTPDGIELKMEGLDKLYFIYNDQRTINIYTTQENNDKENCNEFGYYFNLSYYTNFQMENSDELVLYSINNLTNPINNETIEGNCSFIKKSNYNNYDNYYDNYYDPNQYYLSCHIYSYLFDVSSLEINKKYLDKKDNSLPDIYIWPTSNEQREICFSKKTTCAKSIIFTINEVKDKECLDGTYIFKIIGTLSKNVGNKINL